MLSTMTSTSDIASTTVRIKTLDAPRGPDEQKDLEPDLELEEEPATNDAHTESLTESESEVVTFSGLSSRATDTKNYLQDHSKVKAIVLKHDGSVQEISYDTSSVATRQVLGGRPSIIGEIEDLNLIVVQSLEISTDNSLNQHTLPVPLCHHHAHGDYVVFRVNAMGKADDITLDEYQKYVDDHKTLTETAVKTYNGDDEPIRSNSRFQSTSDDPMKSLRGALEAQILAECDDVHVTVLSNAELQKAVKQGIQKFVDEAVTAMSSSPMDDPDYKPEDDIEQQQEEFVSSDSLESDIDNRPWREQLKDALEHVQEIGRRDGAVFAEKICATFEELGGTAPALDDVANLYDRIRADFANEAESELEDEEESEAESESEIESEIESEEEIEIEDNEWEEALDHIRSVGRKDGKALAVDLYDILYEFNDEEPSLEQLTDIWYGVQEQLAVEAEEESDDDEADYDPDNLEDLFLMDQDAEEDSIHQNKYFDADTESEIENDQDPEELEEALHHIRDVGRMDGQALAENILDILYEVNEEEPSLEELTDLWQSIQNGQDLGALQETDDSAEDDSDQSQDEMSPFEALRFSANTVAADWLSRANSLYLNQKGREPTEDELLETVREFASELADTVIAVESDAESAESAESIESIESAESAESDYTASQAESEQEYESEESVDGEYDPDNTVDLVQARLDLEADIKFEDQHFDQSTLNTPIVESKRGGGVSWSMYFNEEDLSQQAESENLQKAIASFKMRNQRVPSILDLEHMTQFLAVPNESCDDEETAAQSKVLAQYNTPHFAQSKVLVTPVKEKKAAKRFNVYLEDGKLSQKESEQTAIQWFSRFHQREPSKEELVKIQKFVQKDADLTEQQFLVPVRSLNFGAAEDDEAREQGDEEDVDGEENEQIGQFVKVDDEEMIDIE